MKSAPVALVTHEVSRTRTAYSVNMGTASLPTPATSLKLVRLPFPLTLVLLKGTLGKPVRTENPLSLFTMVGWESLSR